MPTDVDRPRADGDTRLAVWLGIAAFVIPIVPAVGALVVQAGARRRLRARSTDVVRGLRLCRVAVALAVVALALDMVALLGVSAAAHSIDPEA